MKAKRKKPKKLGSFNQGFYLKGLVVALVFLSIGLIFSSEEARTDIQQPARVTADYETLPLPVPTRIIARGEKISDVEFRIDNWPKASVKESYLTQIDTSSSLYALAALPAGYPISSTAVSSSVVDMNAVAEGIPAGMRAITVKVNLESAIEGWALPGNSVDVIVVRSSESAQLLSNIIAENVKILSAGRSTEASANSGRVPTTVTLLVSQEDALKIKTAENLGKITFAMRGLGDSAPVQIRSVNQKDLSGVSHNSNTEGSYVGYAKGPEGKTYVLKNSRKWIRADPKLLEQGIATEGAEKR